MPQDKFSEVLDKIKRLHESKKADYSDPSDRFSNFKEAAIAAGVTVEQTFEVLLGIKQARIKQLSQPGRSPQNESLVDSYYDRATYAILALVYLLEKIENEEPKSGPPATDI